MTNGNPNMKTTVFVLSMLLTLLLSGVVSGQQKPTTGYAPVNGLKMYYEVHGSGDPVVLLHGSFSTITRHWTPWIGELSKTRKVIALEMQGHGRTADIKREFSYENLADDVAALLDYRVFSNYGTKSLTVIFVSGEFEGFSRVYAAHFLSTKKH